MKSSRYTNPQDSPGYLLWQVTTMWQKEVRRVLEPLELTQPQFILLHTCLWLNERDVEGKGVTQVQIAQFANVDVNVTSQVLRTLEKRGYVTRARHQTDTRANIITTTPEGTRLAIEGMNLVEESDKNFFELLAERKEGYMEIMQEFIRHKTDQ
ncbi:MarR family transcriptional regulator [Paenibacillus barcinonensis]|uniref:MarR family transcriptional regulator n=1 Tax=Paenibacillus barcinonensis TaxID=198119 RepID=A0A2V4VPP1_PAEBA|nr:MarR family transcriptional regulator [Paenibacillus barcinonensis]PYE44288.1 MarR family transcriptional regulator [Paenibacillus barcinonensis]QKS57656.1 MarR family transcriptional regulator [Paenibacillus barcinonensis]